jgi:hypothetical protein
MGAKEVGDETLLRGGALTMQQQQILNRGRAQPPHEAGDVARVGGKRPTRIRRLGGAVRLRLRPAHQDQDQERPIVEPFIVEPFEVQETSAVRLYHDGFTGCQAGGKHISECLVQLKKEPIPKHATPLN